MYDPGCLVTLVVYVKQFLGPAPVVSVVAVVRLSVVLAGQDVEEVLLLPGQEGQPVLGDHQGKLSGERDCYLVPHCAPDVVLLLQSQHLLDLCCSQIELTCSHPLQVQQDHPRVEALHVAGRSHHGGGRGLPVGPDLVIVNRRLVCGNTHNLEARK